MTAPTSLLEKISFALFVLCLAGMGTQPLLFQSAAYHAFADHRGWLGLPNALDVLSNLAFLAPGLWGLSLASRTPEPLRGSLHLLSTGLVLTALGSALYHVNPNDFSLLWDRVPMVLVFSGVMGAMAYQYLGEEAVHRWQNAWLYLGLVALAVWANTGDLRLYVVVQVGGFLVGAVWIAWGYAVRGRHANEPELPWAAVWVGYGAAKLAEYLDHWVWEQSAQVVGGHAFKHVLAGLGLLYLLHAINKRWPRT